MGSMQFLQYAPGGHKERIACRNTARLRTDQYLPVVRSNRFCCNRLGVCEVV